MPASPASAAGCVLPPSPCSELQHHTFAKHKQGCRTAPAKTSRVKALRSSQIKNLTLLLWQESVTKNECCWGKARTRFPALPFRGIKRHLVPSFSHCRPAWYSQEKLQNTFLLCSSVRKQISAPSYQKKGGF